MNLREIKKMWTIIKIDRKKKELLKEDFNKKLGKNIVIYSPKLLVQKYINNKLVDKEFDLLGDYLFCFHYQFKNPITINKLKFVRGLKYFLGGFSQSQDEIENFVTKCQESENTNGYLSTNFLNLKKNKNYKFSSGPFAETIFKIINLQKNKIDILMGNIKTTINKQKYLISPI